MSLPSESSEARAGDGTSTGLEGEWAYLSDPKTNLACLGWQTGSFRVFVVAATEGVRRVCRSLSVEADNGATLVDEVSRRLKAARKTPSAGASLTTHVLREVPLQTLLRLAEERDASFASDDDDFPGMQVVLHPQEAVAQGFKSIRDYQANVGWAFAAYVYSVMVARGERAPSAKTAEALKVSQPETRNRLSKARARGYLTPVGRGKSGGEVTDAALTLLRTAGFTIPKGGSS